MIKIFKIYVLNTFIVIVFFLSQIVNVNANYLKNNSQSNNISFSVMEQGRKKTVNMSAYVPGLIHEAENKAVTEGKIEKVLEPVTLGTFGLGVFIGYASSATGMLIGLIVGKIVKLIKSSIKS
ncbi:hypothetical protein V3564_01360 [Bartonella sp. B12(2025)]